MTEAVCKTCGGIGEVTVDYENWHLATCPDCLGTGRDLPLTKWAFRRSPASDAWTDASLDAAVKLMIDADEKKNRK